MFKISNYIQSNKQSAVNSCLLAYRNVRLAASNYLPPRHSGSPTYGRFQCQDCLWEQGRLSFDAWSRGTANKKLYQARRANQKPCEFVQYKLGLAGARSELPRTILYQSVRDWEVVECDGRTWQKNRRKVRLDWPRPLQTRTGNHALEIWNSQICLGELCKFL